MALYWPAKKVALDIVDDPLRRPFEGDDSYTVVRVTCAELYDFDSCRRVMEHLCRLLDVEVPSSEEWERRARSAHEAFTGPDWPAWFPGIDIPNPEEEPFGPPFDDIVDDEIEILATSDAEAQRMRSEAERNGQSVRSVNVWDGPIPQGSYRDISGNMRMSTPEYFFFRKSNQLPFPVAVSLGIELCGKFRTSLTQYTREDGYDFFREPRTTKARIRSYLRGARGTKEYKRAKRVLRHVVEDCCSPMGSYLYQLLCLPASQGGYGLDRATVSGAFESSEGFLPAASSAYLAYDLCWADKQVAVQYTGAELPSERQASSLNTQGMQTVFVTTADIEDPDRFDRIARKVARLLGALPPETTKSWIAARTKLRERLPMPSFSHMRLTLEDLEEHMAA